MPRQQSKLKCEARAAKAQGMKRLIPSEGTGCSKHNGEHYAASSSCCQCVKENKKPVQQAEYWEDNKEEINARRREAYSQGLTSIVGI
jgi:hypothetical protein